MTLKFTPGNHQYRLDGKVVPSVTTLLKGLPKDGLMYWSARSVAEYVADNQTVVESLWDAGRDTMVNALKGVPWSERDAKGVRGTDVHSLIERISHGEEVEVPDELAAHVESGLAFLDEWNIQTLLTECNVGNRTHMYAGRFDLIGSLPDGRTGIFDYKTATGVYNETAYQLAAYAHAEFYTTDADPADEKPLPRIDFGAVVHVRADGYDVYPVGIGDDIFEEFLAIARVGRILKQHDFRGNPQPNQYVATPMEVPA